LKITLSFSNQKLSFGVFLRIDLRAKSGLFEFSDKDLLIGVHTTALSLISLEVVINTFENVGLVL